MPTDEEWEELRKECTWTWTTQNGVNGYLVTSPSPLKTSIFLPAAGYCYEDELLHDGESGVYWSSSLNQSQSPCALTNLFDENEVSKSQCMRIYGPTVRAVCR